MSGAAIHIDDLSAEQRKQLGLASMASLSRAERERVLKQAIKVNTV